MLRQGKALVTVILLAAILSLAVIFSLYASLDYAQSIPPYITYQGRLVDQASGAPVNGTKFVTFSLYDSATGGTPIYSQTQQVNIVNGAFSVYLGKGDKGEGNYQGEKVSDGIPAAVFTEHSARYLGVKIQGSSSEMTPRQLLASVAYAYKAEKANEAERAREAEHLIASGFNPVPATYWPDFDAAAPFLLKNALWVGWDSSAKAWKYYKESANDRGVTDPGNPTTWSVNGTTIGYFDGDLPSLPSGTHSNNRYNPRMMAARCDQDDIQVKVGSFWVDKYACRIIDVGANYTGTVWKDDSADMTTSANLDVPPYWMAFSQRAQGSTGMTWFVAAKAAANAGKKLPSNAEWQTAALGTARSTGNGIANGSIWSSVADQDVAQYGVVGMAGNLWEWVADWGQAGKTWQTSDVQNVSPWPSSGGYGGDNTWNINGRADNGFARVDGAPAALLRGAHWDHEAPAGVFAINAFGAPSSWYGLIGFRCSR
jgi:formylglycine-generating enzyme required for sulfatase activity